MKLLDMFGNAHCYPFFLGSQGRGRVYEEVRCDQRRPPSGDSVGFAEFTAGGRTHCVITCDTHQPGLLVRCNSYGCYTKNSNGAIALIAGDASMLAAGIWASGDAGRLSSGPDELWYVRGPALIRVRLSGGSLKGYGTRYVLADASRVSCYLPRDLIQIIATDDDPWVTTVLRALRGSLPSELDEAFAAGERLEAAMEAATSTSVRHYLDGVSIDVALQHAGVVAPAGYSGGYGDVDSGVLLPGLRSLVYLVVGPGGGKRYAYEILEIEGLDILSREPLCTSGNHCSSERIVGLVEGPFSVTWQESRDGEWGPILTANQDGIRGAAW